MLTKEVFEKGLIYLTEAFPSRSEVVIDFWYERLKDLRDDAFKHAVLEIVDNITKLYPDDNLIAMIRERSNDFERLKIDGLLTGISDERWTPPPQEWESLKEKLGLRKDRML